MPKENAMNSSAPRNAVVAGVDGSPTSDLALDFAAEEATRKRLPLHSIHSFPYGYPYDQDRHGIRPRRAERPRRRCPHGRHRARTRGEPTLQITWQQPPFSAAVALVHASETANTVVVGARGMSAVRGRERRPDVPLLGCSWGRSRCRLPHTRTAQWSSSTSVERRQTRLTRSSSGWMAHRRR
jgi:nucleotide-binding universal stress UspA family protein